MSALTQPLWTVNQMKANSGHSQSLILSKLGWFLSSVKTRWKYILKAIRVFLFLLTVNCKHNKIASTRLKVIYYDYMPHVINLFPTFYSFISMILNIQGISTEFCRVRLKGLKILSPGGCVCRIHCLNKVLLAALGWPASPSGTLSTAASLQSCTSAHPQQGWLLSATVPCSPPPALL